MPLPKKNTGEKTAPKMRTSPSGGKLKSGNEGNKGGTGRPPNEFKNRMRALASRADVETYLESCLKGELGPVFYFKALEFSADRGYGKPTQAVEVTGAEGAPLFKSFVGVDTDAV